MGRISRYIKLNLREKLYLVALGGDVTDRQRHYLFSISSWPPQAGPLVMEEGRRFIASFGTGTVQKRKYQRTNWKASAWK